MSFSDTNPNSVDVSVKLGFFVGTAAVIHPWAGPELFGNSGFESWTAGSPDDWTTSGSAPLTWSAG